MYHARNTKNHKNCIELMEGREGREFIIFDTETTGIDAKKDYIIEFAAMKFRISDKKPELIEKIDLFIRPPFFMDDKVVAVHQITNEYLEDKPTEEEVFGEIQAFFGQSPIILAYNADFDVEMTKSLYKRNGGEFRTEVVIDVMEMGYDLLHGKDVTDHKLGTLTNLLGLDVDLQFHNALDDTMATFRLLMYFYQEYKNKPINPTTQQVYVNAIYFWKGFRKEQSGVYLKTNIGVIYFSTFLKVWCSSAADLSIVDIDGMEKHVLQKTGLTLKELGRMTTRKFETLKQNCRERGVYL